MQMHVLDVQFAHFIIWTPKICVGQVIKRDPDFAQAIPALRSFFKTHIAKELVTRSLETTENGPAASATQDETPSTSTLCYCKKTYTAGENMVGCDNKECPYQWIHFKCAGLKNAPKGLWYCKECRKASRNKNKK